jgi:hypothetical protein
VPTVIYPFTLSGPEFLFIYTIAVLATYLLALDRGRLLRRPKGALSTWELEALGP